MKRGFLGKRGYRPNPFPKEEEEQRAQERFLVRSNKTKCLLIFYFIPLTFLYYFQVEFDCTADSVIAHSAQSTINGSSHSRASVDGDSAVYIYMARGHKFRTPKGRSVRARLRACAQFSSTQKSLNVAAVECFSFRSRGVMTTLDTPASRGNGKSCRRGEQWQRNSAARQRRCTRAIPPATRGGPNKNFAAPRKDRESVRRRDTPPSGALLGPDV